MENRFTFRVFGDTFRGLKEFVGIWVFSDFELVDSYQGGLKYLSKYLQKSTSFAVSATAVTNFSLENANILDPMSKYNSLLEMSL